MKTMFIDLINSEWFDGHGQASDRLLRPRWLKAFRQRWISGRSKGAPPPYFKPERSELEDQPASLPAHGHLETLIDLRELLRRIVETVADGRDPSGTDVKRLDSFLTSADVRHRLHITPDGVRLDKVPLAEDDEWVVGASALSAARFLASGDRSRLKVCGNPGCRWVFYDDSKNRSRRWCDSNLCGNLFKVRRYRSRQRTKP